MNGWVQFTGTGMNLSATSVKVNKLHMAITLATTLFPWQPFKDIHMFELILLVLVYQNDLRLK